MSTTAELLKNRWPEFWYIFRCSEDKSSFIGITHQDIYFLI